MLREIPNCFMMLFPCDFSLTQGIVIEASTRFGEPGLKGSGLKDSQLNAMSLASLVLAIGIF